MTRWQNWSGGVACEPARIVAPGTEAELRAILAAGDAPVRVVGSGHSFTPLCATDGTLISLEKLTGVVGTDPAAGTATLWAGTRLSEVGEPLLADGLALANMGDIDRQTLAGAISTGTHGTGRTLGNLSTQVAGLRLVLADGSVLECSEHHEPEVFSAARVAMGTFGVISQVTLRVLPAYRLHERTWPASFDACVEQLPTLVDATRHFEFFWSPSDDACAMKALNPTEAPIGEIAPPLSAPGRLGRYLTPERVDWSHRIFPSERTLLFNEMEFAVPEEAGPDCLSAIRDLMRTHYPEIIWPIEYRTLHADDVPLSPAFDRATVTISIHQAAELPYERFFSDAEFVFRQFHGRPHWGKLHHYAASQLRALYPRFDVFGAVRERLDPTGRFLSGYLRDLIS
jgi:FAD/FMN-containing dehydrogenase